MHIAFYRLVQDNYTRMHNACYRRSMLLIIVTVDKKHYCNSTYSSRLCFQTSIVSAKSSFFCFLMVLQFESLCNLFPSVLTLIIREGLGCTIFSHLQLSDYSWNLRPITCRYGYNTFLQLPNSYTITKYCAL